MLVMNIVVVQTYSTHVIVVVDDDDDIRHVLLWLVENLIAKVLIRYMNRSYACTWMCAYAHTNAVSTNLTLNLGERQLL
jgi:hypothetical protein